MKPERQVESENRDGGMARGLADRARGADCVHAFRQQFDFVYRCVRRYGADPADIDDLVQDVFIAMWRRWADYDSSRPLRPWLAGIAFRVARCHVRRRRPDPVRLGSEPNAQAWLIDLQDHAQNHEERHAANDARALVLSALDRLPDRHRMPLVMHDLDELTINEIAALLDLPLATVYTRVRRARIAFAKVVVELQQAQREQAHFALLGPTALLGIERVPPAAPAQAVQRAVQSARSIVELPEPPPDPLQPGSDATGPASRAPWAGPRGITLIGAGIAGLALLALVPRRSPPIAPPAAAMARKSAAASASLALPALPAFRPVVEPAALRRTVSAAALGQGLTGYWPLDDGPDSQVIKDQSGAGRDCVLHEKSAAATWVAGVHGRALALDGKAWLECPQPVVQREGPVALSVAVWVKRSGPKAPAALVTRQLDRSYKDQFFFGFKDDSLRVVSHTWQGWASVAAPPVSEAWVHAAFTHQPDGTTVLYLSGAEVSRTKGGIFPGTGPIGGPVTIGAGQFAPNPTLVRQLLEGAVDEVLIYNRALSSDEVAALADGVLPVRTAP